MMKTVGTAAIALCAAILLFVAVARSQNTSTAVVQNAALRYWMAFAQMRDESSADTAVRDALARVESGEQEWDEGTLGSVLDANAAALETMLRASQLAACDWQPEWELGPDAPIAHLAKARTLARLNTIAGLRLAAAGDSAGAAERWLAGLRFARHIADGGTLISVYSAWTAFRSTIGAIERAAASGRLANPERQQLAAAIRRLPDAGFDWSLAFRNEGRVLEAWIARLRVDSDFQAAYERALGAPPPGTGALPTESQVLAFRAFVDRTAEALSQAPDAAAATLSAIERDRASLHDLFGKLTPSLQRINGSRLEVVTARSGVLTALE